MNVGDFDTKVVVRSATQTIGTQGQKKDTYTTHSTVWAKVDRSQDESVADYNLEAGASLSVTMYKIDAMTTRWQLQIGGKNYEITRIDTTGRESRFCTVTCSAING